MTIEEYRALQEALEGSLPSCGHWKEGGPYAVRFQDDPMGIEGEYRIVCERQIDTGSGVRHCQDEGPRLLPNVIEQWFAAARQTLDRWQECGECRGSGWKSFRPDIIDYGDGIEPDPCPRCGGSGLLPNQARLLQWCKRHDYPGLGTQTGSCQFGAGLDEPCDLFTVSVRAFDKEQT